MIRISKITIENLQHKVPVSKKRIKNIVLTVLKYLKADKKAQFNIYFVSDRKIAQLNRKYLGENRSTDVISFDISADLPRSRGRGRRRKGILADIFISADTAVTNARIFKTSVDYEFCLYVVHGILHLFGFDDATPRQSAVIRKKEKQILSHLSRNTHNVIRNT